MTMVMARTLRRYPTNHSNLPQCFLRALFAPEGMLDIPEVLTTTDMNLAGALWDPILIGIAARFRCSRYGTKHSGMFLSS